MLSVAFCSFLFWSTSNIHTQHTHNISHSEPQHSHNILRQTKHKLTCLAVILSVTRGRGRMQKTVAPSLTQGMDHETDGHSVAVIVTLHCGESVAN